MPPSKKPRANSANPSSKATPSSVNPGALNQGSSGGGGGGAGQIIYHNIKGVGCVPVLAGAGGAGGSAGPQGATGGGASYGTAQSPVTPDTFMAYRVCLMLHQEIIEGGISPETWDQLSVVTDHTRGDYRELPERFVVPPVSLPLGHTSAYATAVAYARTFASRARLLLLRLAGRGRPADH